MRIYIICPVRNITQEQKEQQETYTSDLEHKGHTVYYPPRNAPQKSKTGYEIVVSELEAIKNSDEIHVFWDINSKGSHFDLGMAFALEKTIRMIKLYQPDSLEKSYVKVINESNVNKYRQ